VSANVLFVVFDTARADAFEPYGAPAGSTPAIAELAARGTAHPAAFSAASWTVPSHAAMFSGQLPRSAGFQHRGGTGTPAQYRAANRSLASRQQSLPVVLQQAGLETKGVSGNTWIAQHTGFHEGFDQFEVVTGGRPGRLHRKGLRDRLLWRLEGVRARLDDGAASVATLVEDWARRSDRRPFFWFVNLIECHSPYLPPKPWNPLGPVDRWKSAAESSEYLNLDAIWRCSLGGFDVPDDAIERMRVLHAASATQLDAWLARVLEALDRHGLLDETQIVLTSDHGENLGEGRLLGHAFSLDDRLIRIPLVTAGPTPLDSSGVMRLSELAGFVAEAAGVEEHPFDDGLPAGVAVAQLDAPADGLPQEQCIQSVASWNLADGGKGAAAKMATSMSVATDGTLKLTRPIGSGARAAGLPAELLVDLRTDPIETRPAAPTPAQETEFAASLKLMRTALDRAAELERPRAVPLDDDAVSGAEEEHIAEQMRHLGYL
jgi:arylsulfatase A-like enzyme